MIGLLIAQAGNEKMFTLNRFVGVVFFFIIFLIITGISVAVDEKKDSKKAGKTSMLVTTAEITEGTVEPMTEFIGSTYFVRVSQVAAEIEGLVKEVNFEVGDMVRKGDRLVLLDSELLKTNIIGTRAAYEQNLIDLENAERDFKRFASLFKKNSISETRYDAMLTKKKQLEKLSIVLESKLKKLLVEQTKKSILAPFGGIIVKKTVEIGEWLPKGGEAAVIADNSQMDVLVDIPAEMLDFLKKGDVVQIQIGNRRFQGRFFTFIPRGDIATRSFTAKFRIKRADRVLEGMEAVVKIKRGKSMRGLLVPRDAIINKNGINAVSIVVDNRAKIVPVSVGEYMGLMARVTGAGLEKGQKVIVQGCKRVSEGQPVQCRQ